MTSPMTSPTAGRRAILSGSLFEERIGYARAVVDGDWVHVSGTTGFDYTTMTISDDVVEQAEQCLRNIGAALAEAGCGFADVVRVRYLLPDRADFEPCWPVLRGCFGEVRPAATMMVCGLADPRMRIEIEVYARRPAGREPEAQDPRGQDPRGQDPRA
ncbi:RidA family protein [Streptomyces sp. NPDC006622]|uniref:RidA family protein n=1 Tax=Streptomyces sp. NPDC006622 TaxID=3155459 RepID=UPI0033B535DF